MDAETTAEINTLREQQKAILDALKTLAARQREAAAPALPSSTAAPLPSQIQPIVPNPAITTDVFSQLRGLIGAFGELRRYDQQVINEYQAMQNTIVAKVQQSGEGAAPAEAPEDKMIMQMLSTVLANRPQQPPAAPALQSPPAPPAPISAQHPTPAVVQPVEPAQQEEFDDEEDDGMQFSVTNEAEAIMAAKKLLEKADAYGMRPDAVKQMISSGTISLDDAKGMVRAELPQGVEVTDASIELVYNVIKEGKV